MAKTLTMTTEQFTCPSCVTKIEKSLGRMDGVSDVKVKFTSNKVDVSFDQDAVSPEQISSAVSKLGYPVLKLKVR